MTSTRQRLVVLFSIVVVPILTVLACAPKPAPPPAPKAFPATGALTPAQVVKPEGALGGFDERWNQVVQAGLKERSLNLYSFSFMGESGIALGRAFKTLYGIDINIVTGRGAEFVERLKTERRMGKMTADVLEGANTHSLLAKDAGVAKAIPDLPVFREQGVWRVNLRAVDPFIVPYQLNPTGFYMNRRLVKVEEEPKSYYDLLQSRWRGNIVLSTPKLSSTMYTVFLTLMNRGLLRPEYIDNLAKQDLKFGTGVANVAELVARGEGTLGLTVSSQMLRFASEGVPLKLASMKEGNIVQTTVMNLISDSPHPNAALVFINWIFSKEGSKLLAEVTKTTSVRADVSSGLPAELVTDTALVLPTNQELDEAAKAFASQKWTPLLFEKQ